MTESWHEYTEREAEEARLAERQERSQRFLPKRGGDVMTSDEVLLNKDSLSTFIRGLASRKMDNMSGSAYRRHPVAYWESGVLFVSPSYRDAHIAIASVPTTKIRRGSTNSSAHGNPYPRVDEGELVEVWDNDWTREGPWIPVIHEIITGLIVRMEQYDRNAEAKKIKEEEDRIARKKAKDEQLLKAWQHEAERCS